jgi:hypothetical protein
MITVIIDVTSHINVNRKTIFIVYSHGNTDVYQSELL